MATAWVDSLLRGEGGGEWPDAHPLPLPQWLPKAKPPLRVASVLHYEELASHIELAVQQLLQQHHYNTVGNFIRFYEAYASSRDKVSVGECLEEYIPPITPEHHTCVGLGLTLISKLYQSELCAKFPGLHDGLHVVSCEEAVDDPQLYVQDRPHEEAVEKEHVLVALRIDIDGRQGMLLLDPGYHVARVVTIMTDEKYPHTGWFTQSDDAHVKREYQYTFTGNQKYVLWTSRETRGTSQTVSPHLVYVERPYVSPVDVTERRNLVYDCRSLLARDTKGQLIAGLYFRLGTIQPHHHQHHVAQHQVAQHQVAQPQATIFYTDSATTNKTRIKIPFHLFLQIEPALTSQQLEALIMCNKQLGLADFGLQNLMSKLAFIMLDNEFINSVLEINQAIAGVDQH